MGSRSCLEGEFFDPDMPDRSILVWGDAPGEPGREQERLPEGTPPELGLRDRPLPPTPPLNDGDPAGDARPGLSCGEPCCVLRRGLPVVSDCRSSSTPQLCVHVWRRGAQGEWEKLEEVGRKEAGGGGGDQKGRLANIQFKIVLRTQVCSVVAVSAGLRTPVAFQVGLQPVHACSVSEALRVHLCVFGLIDA